MPTLSELAGRPLVWRAGLGMTIPDEAERQCELLDGQEPVGTAKVMWRRQQFFDAIIEAGEGSYEAHLDLTKTTRPGVAWKSGQGNSLVGSTVTSESVITCQGLINTQSGRHLLFAPTHPMGGEYTIFAEGGPRLITLSASGGDPGWMLIAPEEASDVEMPGLVAMAFAIANEQVRLLHRTMR